MRFPMPRYFFHVHHHKLQLDHDGEELPDKHAAWQEAAATAARILPDIDGLRPGDQGFEAEMLGAPLGA